MAELPIELWIEVWSFVPSLRALRTVAPRVCKRWHRELTRVPRYDLVYVTHEDPDEDNNDGVLRADLRCLVFGVCDTRLVARVLARYPSVVQLSLTTPHVLPPALLASVPELLVLRVAGSTLLAPAFPPTLQILNVAECRCDTPWQRVLPPKLSALQASRTDLFRDSKDTLSAVADLEWLVVQSVQGVDAAVLARVPRGLRHLDVSACPDVTDAGLEALVRRCPNLDSVVLSHCPGVTNRGVLTLVRSLPRLAHLNVWRTGVTALPPGDQWLSQGVEVVSGAWM